MMIKPGDRVAIIDDPIEGTVQSVFKDTVIIETTDGFQMEFYKSEVVRLDSHEITWGAVPFSRVLQEKEFNEPKIPSKRKKGKKRPSVPEIDLHLESIVPADLHLEDYEKLPFQLDFARDQLEKAMQNRTPKVIFIHGKGDGILKTELGYLLSRYNNIKFYPADPRKYQGGAVEVYFIQNAPQ